MGLLLLSLLLYISYIYTTPLKTNCLNLKCVLKIPNLTDKLIFTYLQETSMNLHNIISKLHDINYCNSDVSDLDKLKLCEIEKNKSLSDNLREIKRISNYISNTQETQASRDLRKSLKLYAFIIVDMQNDFISEAGTLAVKHGNDIVTRINIIRDNYQFDVTVLTQDYHPKNHISFVENNYDKGAVAFKELDLGNGPQMMWPRHCVQETEGSHFVPMLKHYQTDIIIRKGTSADIDSYSGFFDNNHLKKTELDSELKDHGITDVYIAGVALDYCVGFTALDAKELGYNTHVLLDATKGINDATSEAMLKRLKDAGVHIIDSNLIHQKSSHHLHNTFFHRHDL